MNDKMKKFDELYAKMSSSQDVEDMKLFGKVMRNAMQYLAERNPEKIEEFIEELEAVNWKNYLTKKEADDIVGSMMPAPKWTKEQVERGLKELDVPLEEMPYYNWYALYTTISMIASDSGETLQKYAFGANQVDNGMLELVYHLALDKLKDKDEVFNIRKYFGI